MTDTHNPTDPATADPLESLTLAEENQLYDQTGSNFSDFPRYQEAMAAKVCARTLMEIADSDLIAIANGETLLDGDIGGTSAASEFLEMQIRAAYTPGQTASELATATRLRLKSIESVGNYAEYFGFIAWLLDSRDQTTTKPWAEYYKTTTTDQVLKRIFVAASLPDPDDQTANTDTPPPTQPAHSGQPETNAKILNITQPATPSENTGG